MRRIPLLAFFLICGTAQASEGSWQVTDEEVCRKYKPSIPLDVCMAEQKAEGVRALEVESQCTAAFPNDVKANTDCREICWARKDDAASCALEATTLIEKYREEDRAVKDADRHHMIVIGVLSTVVLVLVLLLIVKRIRSAIGSFIARGIYAVSGLDMRNISERWGGYRSRDQEDSNHLVSASTEDPVSAAAPIPEEQTRAKKGIEPAGIGGWLILPAVGLGISPILHGIQFFRNIMPALEPNVWRILSDPTSENYHPMWVPTILFEAASTIVLFIFTLWLGYFFFRKSPRVPQLFIFWLAINLVIQTIDLILMNSIPLAAGQSDQQVVGGLVRSIGSAAIWIPYFIKSVRVKNTFTRAAAS